MGLKTLQKQALELNDVASMVKLGKIYLLGIGVDKNEKEAYKWFEKASNMSNAEAKTFIAYMYLNGIVVKQDDKKAVEFYKRAADLGDPVACYTVGLIYKKGLIDQDPNPKMAQKYFELGAEKGNTGAKYELSIEEAREAFNQIKSIDPIKQEEGYKTLLKLEPIYKAAADNGIITAKYALGVIYAKSKDKEKQKLAAPIFEECVQSNINSAYMALGYVYDLGIGVDVDYWKSFECYEKAYRKGNKKAILNIIYANIMGLGCTQNFTSAINLARDAVNSGIKEANYFAGILFKHGFGVEKNVDKAEELFGYAADAGFGPAVYQLGLLADPFHGMGNDEKVAVSNYKKAYELGILDAGAELARIIYTKDKAKGLKELTNLANSKSTRANEYLAVKFEEGDGVAKDLNKSRAYYKEAAKLGSKLAVEHLLDEAIKTSNKDDELLYKSMKLEGGDTKEYAAFAKECKEFSRFELAAYWYAMAADVTKDENRINKIENMLSKEYEKGQDGIWTKKA